MIPNNIPNGIGSLECRRDRRLRGIWLGLDLPRLPRMGGLERRARRRGRRLAPPLRRQSAEAGPPRRLRALKRTSPPCAPPRSGAFPWSISSLWTSRSGAAPMASRATTRPWGGWPSRSCPRPIRRRMPSCPAASGRQRTPWRYSGALPHVYARLAQGEAVILPFAATPAFAVVGMVALRPATANDGGDGNGACPKAIRGCGGWLSSTSPPRRSAGRGPSRRP